MTKDEALELCDYLECNDASLEAQCKAAAFIREALAQPEQEPVATTYKEVTDAMNLLLNGDYKQVQMAQLMADAKLYTTPPKRPWVGLTDDELVQIGVATGLERAAAQMIESKLKEKNT